MRKSVVLPALLGMCLSGPAFAQTVSGGQAPQADGSIRSSDMGGNDLTSQYMHQKSLNNLPPEQARRISQSALGSSRPAKPSELTAGAVVNDKTGAPIATIAQVDADGVIVTSGSAKVKIPAEAFGHNKAGLLLDTTRADFEKIVAKAQAGS